MQVPQYILDDAYRRREYCKIVVTQPRRIAAISIANRVSHERKWEEGTVVGYQVGLHAHHNEDTRLLYCTTGVLLQKLIKEKTLKSYTHIILDEVHERDQDMDFLLIVIRKFLTTNSKNCKIILMSATINSGEVTSKDKNKNKKKFNMFIYISSLLTILNYVINQLQLSKLILGDFFKFESIIYATWIVLIAQ